VKPIYLDTSIFVKENFLEGKRIRTLLKLFEDGKFQLVMSQIAVNEVKNQFKGLARVGIEAHNQLLNSRQMSSLRNVPESEFRISKFPSLKAVCDSFNLLFDEALSNANAIILPYAVLNIADVFENYFTGKYPFSSGEKKSEFPDAFALESLITWCKETTVRCLVFSKDQDFLKFVSEELDIKNDYEVWLDDYFKETENSRQERLVALITKHESTIKSDLANWVESSLDDFTLYYEHTNYLEIHDLSIEKILIDEMPFHILSADEENITVEFKANVLAEIAVITDDEEFGYFDDEDRGWHYFETISKNIEQDFIIPLTVSFEIISAESFNDGYYIESYNSGSKLIIKRPKRDY
jgi:predicted nucleic acid-binding protein